MAKGKNSLTLSANTREVTEYLRGLSGEMGKATRPIAQAGAQVLYDEAKRLAPVGDKAFHKFYGTSYKKYGTYYVFARGSLKNSIYQKFSKDNSGPSNSTYHVSYNWRFAPYAGFVEYGTSKMPEHSFIRAAGANKYSASIEAMKVAAGEQFKKIASGEKL